MSVWHFSPVRCSHLHSDRPLVETLFCGLVAVGLFLDMAEQGQGQPTYAFTRLDVPGSVSPSNTSANGINDSGQIVGSYYSHGFLLDQGSYTILDVPGSSERTIASGINASAQIVGYYGHIADNINWTAPLFKLGKQF